MAVLGLSSSDSSLVDAASGPTVAPQWKHWDAFRNDEGRRESA